MYPNDHSIFTKESVELSNRTPYNIISIQNEELAPSTRIDKVGAAPHYSFATALKHANSQSYQTYSVKSDFTQDFTDLSPATGVKN